MDARRTAPLEGGQASENISSAASSISSSAEPHMWMPKEFFEYLGPAPDTAKASLFRCTRCKEIKRCGNSTRANLYSHVERKHGKDALARVKFLTKHRNSTTPGLRELDHTGNSQGSGSSRPSTVFQANLLTSFDRQRRPTQSEFEDWLLEYFVMELLPFQRVESENFQRFVMRCICGQKTENFSLWGLRFPSRQTLSRRVKKAYCEIKLKLIELLKSVDVVCTTADAWTSHQRGFLGCTVHWIDPETLERRGACLALRQLTERHTYDVIGKALHSINEDFNLVGKIDFTITDGGSNFAKAFVVYGEELGEPSASGIVKRPLKLRRQEDEEADHDQEEISTSDEESEDDESLVDEDDLPETEGMDFDVIGEVLEGDMELDDYEGLIELPKHGKCGAHKLNLVSTSNASKALQEPAKAQNSRVTTSSPEENNFLKPDGKEMTKYQFRFNATMKKLKAVWNKQSRSAQNSDVIRAHAPSMFPVENATRWNSSYQACDYFNRTYGNKSALDAQGREKNLKLLNSLCKELKLGPDYFCRLDLDFVEEYVDVVRGVAYSLDILQGDGAAAGLHPHLGAGYLLPTLENLLRHLEGFCTGRIKLNYCRPLAIQLFLGVKERFQGEFKDDDLKIAAAVHPRFRLTEWLFNQEEEATRIKQLVKDRAKDILKRKGGDGLAVEDGSSDDTSSGPESAPLSAAEQHRRQLRQFMGGSRRKKRKPTSLVELNEKIEKYLTTPRVGDDHVRDFEDLKQSGLKDLFIQTNTRVPSSAAVERLFSLAGRIFVPLRARLTGKMFGMLTFLRANWGLMKKY